MKIPRYLEQLAAAAGLQADFQSRSLFGAKNGYVVCVATGANPMTFSTAVSRGGGPANYQEIKQFVKSTKAITGCTQANFRLTFTVRAGMSAAKQRENLRDALEQATQYLLSSGYQNCCQNCGAAAPTESCIVNGAQALLCESCFSTLSASCDQAHQKAEQKPENVLAGTVGALLGSLLGVGALVLLGQLGYVAAVSGIIMAVCALKGYELLGGKLSKKGIVISCVIILAMVYLGNWCDWAVSISRYYSADFLDAFQAIPELVSEEAIDPANYYGNLAMHYLFALLGAVPTILGAIKRRQVQGLSYRMSGLPAEIPQEP
jgi:hypothetical protein